MAVKIRKQVYIEPDQERRLKKLTKQTGMTEAEIIRKALDLQLHEIEVQRRASSGWAAIEEFINKRMMKAPSAEPTWNREELYGRKVLSRH
jgi:predicted DNA-binding protein